MVAPLRLASATCVLAPSGRHFFLLQRPLCLKPSLHSAVAGVARPTMASTPLIAAAMADFADVAKAAGAGPDMLEYLEARSLHRTATLALVADTWDDVDKKVFRPFADGFLAKGKKLQVSAEEAPVAQAILRQMWCECRRQWDEVSRPAPAPAVSAPGAGSTTGAPLAPLPSDRPPKDFPHWSRLVAAYNGVLVGGEKREFPTIELLGAEEVLSRIHWEHTKSKLYTPVGIGEILAKRTFSALGVVNTLAVKRNSGAPQQLRLVDGNIAVAEDRPFTPKGVWAVVDGITAIKWAWTLIGVGSEKAVEDYAKWWITKARLHSARIDAIADYWEAASQRLASRMRLGHTFDAESAAIIEDHPAFNEAMLASRPPVGKKPGGTAGGTQHQHELPDRGDEDGPARPGKGRGRGRRRPGKRQRETASADQDHDQDWRRGRWGRQADDGGADHNDAPAAGASGSGSSGPAVEMIRDASGARRPRTGARHGPAGAATRAGTRAGHNRRR